MTQLNDIALTRQAQTWYREKRYDDVAAICHQLLQRNSKNTDALGLMCDVCWHRRRREESLDYAKRLMKVSPRDPLSHIKYAQSLSKLGREREAIQVIQKALKVMPGHPEMIVALAHFHDVLGEPDVALSLLEPFIAAGTDLPEMARKVSSIYFERKEYQRALDALGHHLGSPHVPASMAELMLFQVGQIYERLGDFDKSFSAYAAANDINKPDADPMPLITRADDTIAAFSKEAMAKFPRAKNTSRLPVFIVCRPRSGSTLVERIIASHPDVHAGGERGALGSLQKDLNLLISSTLPYPQCIRDIDANDVETLSASYLAELQQLAPKAKRITDKNVGTWHALGLVNLLFPNAVVIDLRRDPVDNCLGCFTVHLAEDPTMRDLRAIGAQHREYERFMDHWYEVCDIPILRVNYEDIVADQETWSRKIIEHCGLEWDDRVLRFYEKGAQQSTTANPTLSFKQVRQPIYKTSVSRAKKFEKHLGPLYEALGLPWPPADEKTTST